MLAVVLAVAGAAIFAAFGEEQARRLESEIEGQADPRFGVVESPPLTSVVETGKEANFSDQISQEVKEILPRLAPVYRVSSEEVFTPEKIGEVYFGGLSPQTLPNGEIIYTDGNRQLYTAERNLLSYSVVTYPQEEDLPTVGGAGQAVTRFLEETGLDFPDLGVDAANAKYVFFRNKSYPVEASPSRYDSIFLAVRRTLEGIEVAGLPFDASLAQFIVGPGNKIVNIKFFYQKLEGEAGHYPLKSFNEAWELLVRGQGTVVSASRQGESREPEELGLTSATITGVTVKLLENRQTEDFITPVYVFTGYGTFSDGSTSAATIYLPALAEEYLE